MSAILLEAPAGPTPALPVDIAEPERVRLWGYNDGPGFAHADRPTDADTASARRSTLALLYGAMVDRAGIIQHYRSDLYHDALWLDREIHDATTFWWAPYQSGTNIGHLGDDLFRAQRAVNPDRPWYIIDLVRERGLWFAIFTLHTPKGR